MLLISFKYNKLLTIFIMNIIIYIMNRVLLEKVLVVDFGHQAGEYGFFL